MFRGKTLDSTGLFMESTKLIRIMRVEEHLRQKVFALAFLIAGKVVDSDVLDKIYDEVRVMSTGNVILDVAEARGKKYLQEEIALKMLSDGFDGLDIVRCTGIDADRLLELRESVRSEAV